MNSNHMNNLFLLGVDAYNSKSFYDAHEYWEDLWSDYKISDADFVQGMIQLAVAYFHITNSNKKGAISLFNKSPDWSFSKERVSDIVINPILIEINFLEVSIEDIFD